MSEVHPTPLRVEWTQPGRKADERRGRGKTTGGAAQDQCRMPSNSNVELKVSSDAASVLG